MGEMKVKTGELEVIKEYDSPIQKVSQNGSIVAIDTDGSILSTSVQEARMLSTDTQPDATAFPKGTYLIEIDTDVIYYNDGNGNWVEK